MRRAVLLALVLALPAAATTIPPDLQARADALSRTAPPAVLSWVHNEGLKVAKATGSVDVRSIEAAARSSFGVTQMTMKSTSYANLGTLPDGDIMAICFIVLMEATKSAQEDLKSIMDGVKAINKEKEGLRSANSQVNQQAAALAKTPTQPTDRVSQLVTAARGVESRLGRSDLAHVALRR